MNLDELTLDVDQQITINSTMDAVFAGVIRRMTEDSKTPGGPMPMKLERWPGGRWFRDLGEDTGHLWGHVQVIKPPGLLEITGPMFMSYPATGHMAIRLTEENGRTTVSLRHRVLGFIQEDHRDGLMNGWGAFLSDVKQSSETK